MYDDGAINHDALKKLTDSLFSDGVHGVYVGGSTGEGILLSLEERKAVLQSVIEAAGGRGCIMVHIGAVATDDAIRLAQHAEAAGADAISAVPPFAFGKTREGILAHYRALASSCGLPLYLYNIPSLTSVDVTQDLIEELVELPTVRGMKFSSYNLFAEYRILRNVRNFAVFHGCDEILMGAVGGIGLTYNFLPLLYVRIFEEHQAGNLAKANQLQLLASRFVDIYLNHSRGNEVGIGKALLSSYRPVAGGAARLPNLPVSPEATARLLEDLEKSELLGLTSQTIASL
jgi:N-acetylneuraminate lyase